MALSGEPQVVSERVGRDPSDAAAFAASADGDLVVGRGRFQTRLVWFDRSGRRLDDLGPPAHWADPAISPDGTRVAFVFRDRSQGNENLDLWIDAGANHVRSRVTFDPSIDVLPVWSPDGRDLVFRSNRSGYSDLYRKRVDASTPETRILASKTRKDPTDWSADGASILFTDYPSPGHRDIWLLSLTSAAAPRAIVKGRAIATNGRFSPDGRYIAYESSETGDFDVYVESLSDPRRWRVSTDGGTEPAWGRDGRELFFISHSRQVNTVEVSTNPDGLAFGKPRTLFDVPVTAWLRNAMTISPDGQRFLITVDESDRSTHLNVMLNWRPSGH
jgi:Tol biopolymer transport system component